MRAFIFISHITKRFIFLLLLLLIVLVCMYFRFWFGLVDAIKCLRTSNKCFDCVSVVVVLSEVFSFWYYFYCDCFSMIFSYFIAAACFTNEWNPNQYMDRQEQMGPVKQTSSELFSFINDALLNVWETKYFEWKYFVISKFYFSLFLNMVWNHDFIDHEKIIQREPNFYLF